MTSWALFLCGDELPTVIGSRNNVEAESYKYIARWMDKRIEQIDAEQEEEYRTAGVPYIT